MARLVQRAVALFLVAHGFAHAVGFVGSWRLGEFEDAPYTTSIFNGAIDVGDVGTRVVGLLWAAAALAFIAAGVAVWRGSSRFVAPVTAFSLGVCLIGLPASIAGVAIDVAILAVVVASVVIGPARLRPVPRRQSFRRLSPATGTSTSEERASVSKRSGSTRRFHDGQ
jgi:hypothetical protein